MTTLYLYRQEQLYEKTRGFQLIYEIDSSFSASETFPLLTHSRQQRGREELLRKIETFFFERSPQQQDVPSCVLIIFQSLSNIHQYKQDESVTLP